MSQPQLQRDQLENIGSLITIKGSDNCLGFLIWNPKGGAVFDAEYGRIYITPDEAQIHNKAFGKALVDGLDQTCEVGQQGQFYFRRKPKPCIVTFNGDVASDDLKFSQDGRKVTFTRGDREFEAKVPTNREPFCIVVRTK